MSQHAHSRISRVRVRLRQLLRLLIISVLLDPITPLLYAGEAQVSAPDPLGVGGANRVVLAVRDKLVKVGDGKVFETTLIYNGARASLTKQFFIDDTEGIDVGTRSPMQLSERFAGIETAWQVEVVYHHHKFRLPKSLASAIVTYLTTGPDEQFVLRKPDGSDRFTCHQFALFSACHRVRRFAPATNCYHPERLGSPSCSFPYHLDIQTIHAAQPAHYVKALSQKRYRLRSGDYVLFLDKDFTLVHSAIVLGHVEGELLYLSKIGVGPLSVATFQQLRSVYPESERFARAKKILLHSWNNY